jgi:hypothetical protein
MGLIGVEVLYWISVSIKRSHVRDLEFIWDREIYHLSCEGKACIAEQIIHHQLFVRNFLRHVLSHLIILGLQVFHLFREDVRPFLVLTFLCVLSALVVWHSTLLSLFYLHSLSIWTLTFSSQGLLPRCPLEFGARSFRFAPSSSPYFLTSATFASLTKRFALEDL